MKGEKVVDPGTSGKCRHREPPKMGYLDWHDDADRRARLGQRQRFCPACKRFLWNYLFRRPR